MDDISTPTLTVKTTFAASLFDGDLPPDWAIGVMDDVLTGTEYGLSEPGDAAGDTSIVGMRDLVDGIVRFEELATVDSGGNDWSKFRLRRGDILLNRTNSPDLVGKIGYVREDFDAVFASYLVRLHVDPRRADAEYVAAWLNSGIAQRALKRLSTRGVSQANINPTEFRRHCPIPLPPLSEQRKIAEILRTWDEALERLAVLRAAKELQYRAFARKFFDPCHPSFHGRPNNWQEFEQGDIFTERSQVGADGERLLSVTMNGGVIDRNDVGRKDTSTEDKSRYKLVLPGDIAYNTMRMWQGVSGLSTMRGIVSPAYTVVTPLEKRILGCYAVHLFKSRRMVFDFERYSQGLTSDTWNLKFPAFSKIKVWLPPTDDQEKQADLLDAMMRELGVLRRQFEALTFQKRGLMQKLLTGEWRLDAEREGSTEVAE